MSGWGEDQWAAFVSLLTRGFAARDPFTDEDAQVYRLLLADVEPEAAVRAVRELVGEGQALRPKPGEIVQRVRRDPGRPTFDEAFRLIYGPRGVLSARPAQRRYGDAGERARAYREAALERADAMHPAVAGFVRLVGVDELREIPLDDEEYGRLRRKELEARWAAFLEAGEEREIRVLAAGGREGLRALDPLAALGIGRPELEAG